MSEIVPVQRRGEWIKNTPYGAGDCVTYNEKSYVCATATSGDATFPTLKFAELTGDLNSLLLLATGPQGQQGIQGVRGPTGPQGLRGYTGATGQTGAQGPKGDKGNQGDRGLQGIQGVKGDRGPDGIQGLVGPEGPQGPQGVRGFQGPAGDRGLTGGAGPKGEPGTPGVKGDQGSRGSDGTQGPKGDKGVSGDRGPQGPKGDTGLTGPEGPAGPEGPQGPQGEPGSGGGGGLGPDEVQELIEDQVPVPVVITGPSRYNGRVMHTAIDVPGSNKLEWVVPDLLTVGPNITLYFGGLEEDIGWLDLMSFSEVEQLTPIDVFYSLMVGGEFATEYNEIENPNTIIITAPAPFGSVFFDSDTGTESLDGLPAESTTIDEVIGSIVNSKVSLADLDLLTNSNPTENSYFLSADVSAGLDNATLVVAPLPANNFQGFNSSTPFNNSVGESLNFTEPAFIRARPYASSQSISGSIYLSIETIYEPGGDITSQAALFRIDIQQSYQGSAPENFSRFEAIINPPGGVFNGYRLSAATEVSNGRLTVQYYLTNESDTTFEGQVLVKTTGMLYGGVA